MHICYEIDCFSDILFQEKTIDTSLTSERVVRELKHLVKWRGYPEVIRVDNGPEFIAKALENWCNDKISLQYIQKGKPQQNG